MLKMGVCLCVVRALRNSAGETYNFEVGGGGEGCINAIYIWALLMHSVYILVGLKVQHNTESLGFNIKFE